MISRVLLTTLSSILEQKGIAIAIEPLAVQVGPRPSQELPVSLLHQPHPALLLNRCQPVVMPMIRICSHHKDLRTSREALLLLLSFLLYQLLLLWAYRV